MKIDFRWRDSGPARGKKVPSTREGEGLARGGGGGSTGYTTYTHTQIGDANQNKVIQISSSGSGSFSHLLSVEKELVAVEKKNWKM